MKKNTKLGVGGVLFLVTLGGCFVDDEIHLNATALDITVDEARKSFETSVSTFYLSPPTATRAVDMELLVTPLWEKAKSLLFEEKKIVEIPLEAPITAVHRIWTHKDSIPANNKYTNTVTSLIAEKSEAGRIFFTVVKISGEGNYLMRNNKRFLKMRFETLSDFSGAVRYYTLNGELISGKIYKQGKAVKSIAPYDSTKVKKEKEIQQGKARIYTRATVEQCEVHDYLIEQYYCTDTYVGDELMNTYCELADSWIETVMVCDYIEVPDETPNEVCPNCGQNPCGCENPEGGNGEGGSGTNEIVDKAKKLFKNDNMTTADWNKLGDLLSYIMDDCMGEALYNGLLKFLNGNTISFQFTSEIGAAYNPGSNSLKLNGDMNSNELFHEMLHAYQYQNDKSVTSFFNAAINHEIETHYAQYLYLEGTLEYDTSTWRMGVKGGSDRIQTITNLSHFIDEKGNLLPGVDLSQLDVYLEFNVIPAFKSDDAYQKYSYDTNYDSLSNFSNLREITKNC